ncbi:MAG: CPBP family intramembrane glutamic endopeptidase [Pyrinomonadaceae bacterium]
MQNQPELNEHAGYDELDKPLSGSSPNNPPWGSGIAVVVWLVSVLLIVFIPTLFLLPYLVSKMGGSVDRTQIAEFATKDPVAVWIQIAAVLPVHILTLLVSWYVVTNFRKFPFRETLGWQSGGMRWWHYALILAGFVAVMIIVGLVVPEQENELLRILKSSKWALYTIAVLAVFTAPVVEEVIYRGILYSAFQRSVGTFTAVALVTFLFALVHVPQYWPSFSTIFLLTLLSLILTLIRVYTVNLLPCIILHTLFNAFQSALLMAEPHLNPSASPTAEQAFTLLSGQK